MSDGPDRVIDHRILAEAMGRLLTQLAERNGVTDEDVAAAKVSTVKRSREWREGKVFPKAGKLDALPRVYRADPRDFYLGLGVCLLDCVLGTEEADKLERPHPLQDVVSALDKARALWRLSVENLKAPTETREQMRRVRDSLVPVAEYFKLLLIAFEEYLRSHPRVPFESLADGAEAEPPASDRGDPEGPRRPPEN